ncbi:MAG: hypothetical protein C4K58_07800 [Flavobacteriaceae bacterium]|nr:MAG: hypothetical protein C4K58_07800 [Flavobacteriaceae bacterium]
MFDHFNLFGRLNPIIYLLMPLFMPFSLHKRVGLFLGFLMGLWVDILGNSMAVNTVATTLLCFLRYPLMESIMYKDSNEMQNFKWFDVNLGQFALYVILLTFVHHFTLFFFESFKLSTFFSTLGFSLASTLLSCFFYFVYVNFSNLRAVE